MNQDPFEILSKSTESSNELAPFALAVEKYLGSGDDLLLAAIPLAAGSFSLSMTLAAIWSSLAARVDWGDREVLLAKVAIDYSIRYKGQKGADGGLTQLIRMMPKARNDLGAHPAESVVVGLLEEFGVDRVTAGRVDINRTSSYRGWGMKPEPDSSATAPSFESAVEEWIFEASDSELAELMVGICAPSYFSRAVARFRPEVIAIWWPLQLKSKTYFHGELWPEILPYTDLYDQECFEYAIKLSDSYQRFQILKVLHSLRGKHREELEKAATDPAVMGMRDVVEWLLAELPEALPGVFAAAAKGGHFRKEDYGHTIEPYLSAYLEAVNRWDHGGREMFQVLQSAESARLEGSALKALLENRSKAEGWDVVFLSWSSGRAVDVAAALWSEIFEWINSGADDVPDSIRSEIGLLLGNKSKRLREIAIECLAVLRDAGIERQAVEWLEKGKIDQKLGAVGLLALTNPNAADLFQRVIVEENNEKVRQALHAAIESLGGSAEVAESGALADGSAFSPDEFVATQSKGLKQPKCVWLKIDELPPLVATDGSELAAPVVTFLIAKQSKQKEIQAAPDILPLLAQVDREKSAAFAEALVEGFLNSEQAASDRWALTFGGLLGDKRIITLLLPRIQGWCENSRHKLAEYAAQAISLLPGDEPLMVLDTLANRYRSKFKNIGRACSEAFTAAATARGITPDELGDMVVPSFGFDEEGVRRFDWEGGGISAELGADFKLTWFDPETEKSWKSLPAGAPDETKTEVKTVTKLIRETVKAQTARLEMSLVRQRRWPVARWRELFESHPLLSSFASGLVWGVYDVSGNLLRTFRRYPNGILADANGAMEELEETDVEIGMVHPLELAGEVVDGWRAHLSRMKVKQPFPQIDRPVELLDPLHGNRREISLTGNCELSAGTFRSRAEKRGWTRGSVIDAGGIASYYKLYPGAGVEVNLPTENFWVGCDPMETVTLGPACFAKAGTIERGSYIYNEPEPDDPRVLRFDQVPPVVYSETLSDLKAIIATKE